MYLIALKISNRIWNELWQKLLKKAAELNYRQAWEPGCKWKYKAISWNLCMLRWWPREAAESPWTLEILSMWLKMPRASCCGWPCCEQRLGLDGLQGPLPSSVVVVSYSVILRTTDPSELDHRNEKLLFISPGSLLQDLYSNLKVSLRLYLKATWISSGLW